MVGIGNLEGCGQFSAQLITLTWPNNEKAIPPSPFRTGRHSGQLRWEDTFSPGLLFALLDGPCLVKPCNDPPVPAPEPLAKTPKTHYGSMN